MAKLKYLGMTVINQIYLLKQLVEHQIPGILATILESFGFSFSANKVHKTLIVPQASYRCEILSLALRNKFILALFENRILRNISGPIRNEEIGKY